MLDQIAGYGVLSAFSFVAVAPIMANWVRTLKRVAPIQSPPLRVAHLFLRISPPVYALYVWTFPLCMSPGSTLSATIFFAGVRS